MVYAMDPNNSVIKNLIFLELEQGLSLHFDMSKTVLDEWQTM